MRAARESSRSRPDAPSRPQRLIEAVWGEQEVNGPNVVQVVVSKLRRVLADAGEVDRIVTRPAGYQLQIDRDDVDALQFETLVDQARTAPRPGNACELLGHALPLWRGAPLGRRSGHGADTALRSRLEELRRVAVEDMVDAELALGGHRRLAPELEALVAEEPLRERRWGQLIRALYGSGRQADALRAFQRARDVLIEQIGVEPGPELRQLEAAVLAQDESVLGVPTSPGADVPSATGSVDEGTSAIRLAVCIGRTRDVSTVLDRLDRAAPAW